MLGERSARKATSHLCRVVKNLRLVCGIRHGFDLSHGLVLRYIFDCWLGFITLLGVHHSRVGILLYDLFQTGLGFAASLSIGGRLAFFCSRDIPHSLIEVVSRHHWLLAFGLASASKRDLVWHG